MRSREVQLEVELQLTQEDRDEKQQNLLHWKEKHDRLLDEAGTLRRQMQNTRDMWAVPRDAPWGRLYAVMQDTRGKVEGSRRERLQAYADLETVKVSLNEAVLERDMAKRDRDTAEARYNALLQKGGA